MPDTIKSPEEARFVITSLEQLTSEGSPFGWRLDRAFQAGGTEAFFKQIQAIIDKEGGLTLEEMDYQGIVEVGTIKDK